MDLHDIKLHWEDWAKQYGTSLRATTKASSSKTMEVDALLRALKRIHSDSNAPFNILEVGCGNGYNCVSLLKHYPAAQLTGIDYIPEMIQAANALKAQQNIADQNLHFQVGDILNLSLPHKAFDVVYTVRCLINLNTDELQQQAITALKERVKVGGYLLLLENSQQTYNLQNQIRESVDLPKRQIAPFNHFINENTLRPFLTSIDLELVDVDDFISLHDLILYLLVPMINDGVVDYDHPLVHAGAQLNKAISAHMPNSVGQYGQNRLYLCRRKC